MADITEVLSAFNITELLRMAWMEVLLASVAATVYFTLTGWIALPAKKRAKAAMAAASRKSMKGVDQEPSMHQLVLKALRQGKVSTGITLLKELCVRNPGAVVPVNIASRFLVAAAKASDFDDLVKELCKLSKYIEAQALEAAAIDLSKWKDVAACRQLQAISRLVSIPKSQRALEVLAKAVASDAHFLRELVEDAETPLGETFAKCVLLSCATLKDVDLAAEVFEKVGEADAQILRDFVETAATTKEASVRPCAACAASIRECGKRGDLKAAVQIFEEQRAQTMDVLLYNSVIDACIEARQFEQAMDYFQEAQSNGFADIVTYNLAMKSHLSQGHVAEAQGVMSQLAERGLAPTIATYHSFLHSHIIARDITKAWAVVEEMRASGIPPTAVTCTIMLKGKLNSQADINKVLNLVDSVEPIDEVLFCTVADMCIRTGQLGLLSKYQQKLIEQGNSHALTAPTYGSMIKAYGQVRDVARVRELWAEMKGHEVLPTAITFGCMVEALVANRHTMEAWKLVQEVRSEETTRSLVNTVIYSTVLKGFANSKETEKVMSLYEEMKESKVPANTITYNTILNAFAEAGAMQRVPALLEDMKSTDPPIEPDIVTYSTIIKGFCNAGNLDCALNVLTDMQSDGKFSPDEVMYNSLLDGCVKEHRCTDALKLLDDMKKSQVAPSNYTLSIMVKLMGRCRRLNQAFNIVQEISNEYGLKLNIQVYTCLIQACFNNRQPAKAVTLLEQLIEEGVVPDEMTYSALVNGCVKAGLLDKAVHLTKCAYGLATPTGRGKAPGISVRCRDDLVAALGPAQGSALMAEVKVAEGPAAGATSRSGRPGKGSGKGAGGARPPWRQQH